MADWRKDPKLKWVVLGVTVMTAIGFSFGILLSAQQVVNTPGENNNQEQNVTMPSEQTVKEPFDLTLREQIALARQNNVVFVNGFTGSENSTEYRALQNLTETFGDNVYISTTSDLAGSPVGSRVGLTQDDMPTAVIVGGQGTSLQDFYTRLEPGFDQEDAEEATCSVMLDISEFTDTCL